MGNLEAISWNSCFSYGLFDPYLEDHSADDTHFMVKYGCTWFGCLGYVLVSPPVGGGSSSKWGRIRIRRLSVSHWGFCQFGVWFAAFRFVGKISVGEPFPKAGMFSSRWVAVLWLRCQGVLDHWSLSPSFIGNSMKDSSGDNLEYGMRHLPSCAVCLSSLGPWVCLPSMAKWNSNP